ncbi:myb-like DNA-binding protein bas1 [Coemansia sp. BCRC 34962]|nr:myb-like DNA-binding protein bas1 [Coemansia sp. BCRC 34962]
MATSTSASVGNEKRKRIGASSSATAPFSGMPTDSYDDNALPNEAEINAMGVAELRQVVLNFVRVRKPNFSPVPADSPSTSSYLSSTTTFSATASERHDDLGDSAVPTNDAMLQARKRYRNDSDASDVSQRMGIDLLLNASTFSDRFSNSNSNGRPGYQLSMSPPSYSECRSSPPAIGPLSSPSGHRSPPFDADDSYWRDSHKPFSLPPISQLEIRSSNDPAGLGSPPPEGSFSASSLDAYRISPRSPKDTYSYAHSFPPPLSTTRSLAGIAHYHSSSPTSQHSSPTTCSSNSQGPQSAASRPSEAIAVPVPAVVALPPPHDNVVYAGSYRCQPYSASPPRALCTQQSRSPQQQQQQQQYLQPRPQQSPPNPSHVSFSQAQSYFAQQQQAHSHAIPPPGQLPLTQLQTQAQAQPIPINPSAPGLAAGVARNVSKPKFNYAFLDTKRPRGPSSRWSPDEDELLKSAVREHGEDRQWVKVAQHVPGRTNLQCRQRWLCNIKAQVEKERGMAQA